MSFVKKRSNGSNITRYYNIEQVFSSLSAIEWINSIRNIHGLYVEYIYYGDLMNRSDEGSNNVQLDAQVTVETMKKELKTKDVDKERLGSNHEALASSLKPNSPKQAHHEALASCALDIIALNGTFVGKPLVVGVDLRSNLVYLIVRKRRPADVELIEKVLKLV